MTMTEETVKAYMAAGCGRGKYIPQRPIGSLRLDGYWFVVYESTVNDLSAMLRLAPMVGTPYSRCKYIYDAGYGFRKANKLRGYTG